MAKRLRNRACVRKLKHKSEITSTSILFQIEYPVFCLHYLSSNYCLTKCDQRERSYFADTTKILSQVTWTKIIAKKIRGFEKILTKKTINKGNSPDIINEDESIIGFHFHGNKSMLGIRRDCIFHITWFDLKFKSYAHG